MRRNTLVLSILCALSGIGLYPAEVNAADIWAEKGPGNIFGKDLTITTTSAESVYGVYSAYSTNDGTASQNSISVETQINWDTTKSYPPQIVGGYSHQGNASSNIVKVSTSDVYDVFGGVSKNNGSAIGNQVFIGHDVKAGDWPKQTSGTYALVVGGMVQNGSQGSVAQGNTVTVNATDQDGNQDYYINFVLGGQTRGTLGNTIDNTAILQRGHIYQLMGAESLNGDATGNQVFIQGGLVANWDKRLKGYVYGATGAKSVSRNEVTMTGGKVIGDILGGLGGSEANENKVIISGGEIVGSVLGGIGSTVANNNLVEIRGTPNLTQARLFGGNAPQTQGNTLNIKTSGIVVQQIGDFQKLNFHIDQTVDSSPLLKVVGDQSTDISGSDVNVYLATQAVSLKYGDEIVLLENSQGLDSEGFDGSIIYDNSEGLLDYALSFNVTPTTLGIQVSDAEVKPETTSYLSANLSRLAFVNQGSDLLTGQGMVASREASQTGRHLFVALQTGSNHYNDNSYIDLEGESLLIGGSWSVDAFGSQVTLGGFVESGWGDYEAENALTSLDVVKGQGETHYQGAGLLAYWDQYPSADKGFYAEASVRLGRADLSYQMIDPVMNYDYDVSGAYHAAHVGLGFRYPINDENNIDLFTKFYYSHQDSDGFVIDQNSVKMNSITSKRWRAGLSYRHRGFTPEGCVFDWQTSLAYEYEFDGKAQGSIDGFNIIDSELQGSTGIGEVSITFLPSADSDMRLRASIQGFAGTREGFIGQIQWTQIF